MNTTNKKETNPHLHSSPPQQPEIIEFNNLENYEDVNIDEQIINESVLIDPTNLDKTFSYKDCEVNKKLNKNTREN